MGTRCSMYPLGLGKGMHGCLSRSAERAVALCCSNQGGGLAVPRAIALTGRQTQNPMPASMRNARNVRS